MRIGVDVRALHGDQRYQGVGYYAYQLLTALARLDEANEYVLFGTAAPGGLESDLAARFRAGRYQPVWRPALPPRWAEVGDMLLVPWETLRHRVDLFFFPSLNRLAWGLPARSIVVIQDMIPLLEADLWLQTGLKHRLMYGMAARADRILTTSANTRRDVVRLLAVPESRIETVPLAADERFQPAPPDTQARVRARYSLPQPFVLYVGDMRAPAHNRRKNIEWLVEALPTLPLVQGQEVALVLAGKRGDHAVRLAQRAEELGVAERVIFTDYVPDADLPALYSAATLFAYPSAYEGFGLPLLQAMGCGTPTLALRTSSIPEVAGEAGCLVEPERPDAFRQALHDLLTDETKRANYRSQGLRRAATFSWEHTARGTLDLFHRVAAR